MMPAHASFSQSLRLFGKGRRRAKTIAQRITDANRKRSPAKVIGGRSRNPSLIKIQVDPQIRQRISQTMIGVFIDERALKPISSRSNKDRAGTAPRQPRYAATDAL